MAAAGEEDGVRGRRRLCTPHHRLHLHFHHQLEAADSTLGGRGRGGELNKKEEEEGKVRCSPCLGENPFFFFFLFSRTSLPLLGSFSTSNLPSFHAVLGKALLVLVY